MSERQPLLPTIRPDPQELQAAVDRTRSLLPSAARIAGAFSAGKLPTTQQAVSILQAVLRSNVLQPQNTSSILDRSGRVGARLSDDGERVVSDVREAIEATIGVMMEKNDDDKFQNFLYEASQADFDVNLERIDPSSEAPSQREVHADADKARAAVQKLGRLILTSPAFRNLLSDGVLTGRDLFADAAEQAAKLAEKAAGQAKSAADQARPSEQERTQGVDVPSAKQLKKKGREAQDKAKAATRDAQNRVDEASTQAKNFMDEQSPHDVADAALERLRRFVEQVQKDETYRDAVSTLVDLVKKYGSIAGKALDKAAQNGDRAIDADEHTQQAATQLRSIVETIAGGKSLDDLTSKLDRLVKDVQGDERLSQLWDDIAKYLDRLLFDAGYVTSPKASRKFDELYEKSQEIAKSNPAYKSDFDALTNEANSYLEAVKNDKAFHRLGQAFEVLNDDLADLQQTGLRALKAEGRGLARDFWNVILPRAVSLIKEVPLPRIEFRSADFDFAVDNVIFESASFIPDLTRIINHNDLTFEQGYAAFAANLSSNLSLIVRGLRIHARDISYYVNKKTGFFSFEDSGLADVHLGFGGDDGLHFRVQLEKAEDADRQFFFKVQKVEVELDNFEVYFRKSSHSFMLWLFHGSIRAALQQQLQHALQEQIKASLEKADVALFALQQRATAANQAATTPADYVRALFTPSASMSSSSPLSLTSKGLVKTGPHGEWVLAIGVEEAILPGRTGGAPSSSGYDVDVEQGIAQAKGVVRQAQSAADQARREAERASNEANRQRKRELRAGGWRSSAFDI